MATAQTHTAAPQLEARLRHALPLGAHLVVGLRECVEARIPVGGNGYVAWNCRRRAEKKKVFKTDFGLIFCVADDLNLEDKRAELASLKLAFENLTGVAHGYNFLQNFLLRPVGHGFHQDIVGSSRGESNQCGTVGGAR